MLAFFLIGSVLAFSLWPQAEAGQSVERDTLSTSCQGRAQLTPDIVEARITIRTHAPTANDAVSSAFQQVARLNQTLQPEWNLTTTSSSVWEDWGWLPRGERRLRGWQASIMLTLKVPVEDAARVLAELSRVENATYTITYTVSRERREKAEAEAIRDALRVCRLRAITAAETAGRVLGRAVGLNVHVGGPRVYPLYRSMEAGMPKQSLPEPEVVDVTANVDVTYELV